MLKGHSSTSDIASCMIASPFTPKEQNWKHILSKHWGNAKSDAQVWPQLRALLFWSGDTQDIEQGNTEDIQA
jgi:hypothetical protein